MTGSFSTGPPRFDSREGRICRIKPARAESLAVDIIEAGFPASSPGDFEAVKAVAAQVRGARIAGLARAVRNDVERCAEAVKGAASPRIHVFLSTSDIHLMHQLAKDRDTVREMARTMVALAKSHCEDIEF